ncbi:MAG TPA: sodium:solute symporter family protein [Ignavibacteriaceae bacterium]|nr:sodium:solute symporter family protein [Ignavibacteriaceae bacterium]
MVSFKLVDYLVIGIFFLVVLSFGFYFGRRTTKDPSDYLLSGRNVGLFLFILTTVSSWYGGILGVGEFTYKYGLLSWFTQGIPYYIFALLFAFFLAKKVRLTSLYTIPDKLTLVYGKNVGLLSAFFVFILVSPAPYLLMTANIISLIFGTGTLISLILGLMLSISYLINGGFKANIYSDVIQFFVMFGGFIAAIFFAYHSYGGISFLQHNLPPNHLVFTGGASPTFIIVWYLIALWTFADPGFHQRAYAAKTGNTAMYGIIISVLFFALFDFLTTSTGLYARAILPNLAQPTLSYPLLAEKILPPGWKGFFYAAMFATIMSTLNSFYFLSGTTIGRDFIYKLRKVKDENKLKYYTVYGLIFSGILSVILAFYIPSVIQLWYIIGSICIPGMILPVISSYYLKIKINQKILLAEMIAASAASLIWYFVRNDFASTKILGEIEPMLAGLFVAALFHLIGMINERLFSYAKVK